MLQKIKYICSIIIIVVLLPYIVTIFINGKEVEETEEKDKNNELLKEYCINTLAKEVSNDYEDEMLKVQAILVRTTVYKEVEEKGVKIFEEEINNSGEINSAWYKKLEQIWEETDNLVVMYDKKLALVPFHQVSNGKTRNGSEVLGSDEYPYLQSKECPLDVEADNQMESIFIEAQNVKIGSVDSTGYVLSVTTGEETCSGESFRETFGLASSCFEIQEFAEKTRVITKGVGHGLGLSQYTANEMAKEGQGYKEILHFFFTGIEIMEVADILWNTVDF